VCVWGGGALCSILILLTSNFLSFSRRTQKQTQTPWLTSKFIPLSPNVMPVVHNTHEGVTTNPDACVSGGGRGGCYNQYVLREAVRTVSKAKGAIDWQEQASLWG